MLPMGVSFSLFVVVAVYTYRSQMSESLPVCESTEVKHESAALDEQEALPEALPRHMRLTTASRNGSLYEWVAQAKEVGGSAELYGSLLDELKRVCESSDRHYRLANTAHVHMYIVYAVPGTTVPVITTLSWTPSGDEPDYVEYIARHLRGCVI